MATRALSQKRALLDLGFTCDTVPTNDSFGLRLDMRNGTYHRLFLT